MPSEEDQAAGEFLRRFLADRDVDCPGCGYDLRGLTGSICPECGQALVVTLRLREPRQAVLIAGLVGLSMGAGLGGLLLVYLLIVTLIGMAAGGPPDQFLIVNASGFAIHSAAIGVWVYFWNEIRRLSGIRRTVLLAACWLMPLTFVFVFALSLK